MSDFSDRQRKKIAELAAQMLAGSLSFLEGAVEINRMRSSAELLNDPDVLPFDLIDSETDRFPITPKTKKLWRADALEKLLPEIESAEEWAREIGVEHCRNLVSRFR